MSIIQSCRQYCEWNLVIGGVNIFIECNIFGWHQHTDTLLINKHVSQIYVSSLFSTHSEYPPVLESVEGLNDLCSGKCGKWFHGFPPHTMRLVSGLITCCNWWRATFIIWFFNRRFSFQMWSPNTTSREHEKWDQNRRSQSQFFWNWNLMHVLFLLRTFISNGKP